MPALSGEVSVTVPGPPADVYRYLADFTRHPEWTLNLRRVTQITPGASGPGTRFRAREGPPPMPLLKKLKMMAFFLGGLATGTKPQSECEITALEPPTRIAWSAWLPKGSGAFNRASWEFLLEPADNGTRVVQRFSYEPQEAMAARMVGSADDIAAGCLVNLQNLKRIVEARRAS